MHFRCTSESGSKSLARPSDVGSTDHERPGLRILPMARAPHAVPTACPSLPRRLCTEKDAAARGAASDAAWCLKLKREA